MLWRTALSLLRSRRVHSDGDVHLGSEHTLHGIGAIALLHLFGERMEPGQDAGPELLVVQWVRHLLLARLWPTARGFLLRGVVLTVPSGAVLRLRLLRLLLLLGLLLHGFDCLGELPDLCLSFLCGMAILCCGLELPLVRGGGTGRVDEAILGGVRTVSKEQPLLPLQLLLVGPVDQGDLRSGCVGSDGDLLGAA